MKFEFDVICNGMICWRGWMYVAMFFCLFDGVIIILSLSSIHVVCICDGCRIHIHDMAFHGDIHVVFHGVAFHNNAPVVPCDVRVLCGILACVNDIRVFCALHSGVVVVYNDRNDGGLGACILHDVMVYAPPHSEVACALHSVVAYVPHSVEVYALRNAVVFYAHHNMVCALHGVMDNELDPTVFRMYLLVELVMLMQSPQMPQILSEIQRNKRLEISDFNSKMESIKKNYEQDVLKLTIDFILRMMEISNVQK